MSAEPSGANLSLANHSAAGEIRCPLTGELGVPRAQRSGKELEQLYKSHFGLTFPPELSETYFRSDITEYESDNGGLRWFVPGALGQSDFYEFLSSALPWYYGTDSWDKQYALTVLRRLGCKSVFEAGCGSGRFLRSAAADGIKVAGSEINRFEVAAARAAGLTVYTPDQVAGSGEAEALVMLQVLEHVPRPLDFVKQLIRETRPEYLLVAVPCFETLLGRTSDPLSWPPHHISFWSEQALRRLSTNLDATLIDVGYQPLDWRSFSERVHAEPGQKLMHFPVWRHTTLLRLSYQLCRLLRRPWVLRAHTVFGVFKLPPRIQPV